MNIDELTTRARTRIRRLHPEQAYEATRNGAVLVDTRPESQRLADGAIPGAILIERNHLEWRCDPTSSSRIAQASNHDVRFIILCDEGYASSLAAATLQELGLRKATDVIGGFQAWRAAGLPTVAAHHR